MLTLVFIPFALALVAPGLHRALGRFSSVVLAAAVLGLCGWVGAQAPDVFAGNTLVESRDWVPGLGLQLAFHLDGLALVFCLLVTGMGALVLLYGEGYLGGGKGLERFQVLLLCFMGAMLGLVLADDLVLLFVFWELTSITSYLLIGYKHEKKEARDAARRAFLVTALGGLALLVGLLMLGEAGGSFRLTSLADAGAAVRAHPWYAGIVAMICLGAFTKSAQMPFHFWLPGAMAAPTPVSSYLHSATMVKAGVYLLARFHPELGGDPLWNTTLSLFGAVTMLVAAVMAFTARDLKAVLAYTTVGALGTLVLMLGIGTADAVKAAMVFLIVHALYKGALFMLAGVVDKATGTRDLEKLRGLGRVLPATEICITVTALSMAGLPPLFGFIGKELLYEAKVGAPGAAWLVTALGVTANVFVVATAILVGWQPFTRHRGAPLEILYKPTFLLLLGPMVLAAAGLLIGVLPGLLVEPFVQAAVNATYPEPTVVKLALWHGVNPILLLSVATVAAGVVLYALRPRLLRWGAPLAALARIGPSRAYEACLAALVSVASWQTRTLQHGLLRRYVALAVVVVLVLTALPLASAETLGPLPFDGAFDLRAHEVALVLAIAIAGISGARARGRLAVVLSLGVIGISLSILFLGFGAPDVAMTQVVVETLAVMLFLFVARLPRVEGRGDAGTRRIDGLLAGVTGLALALLVRHVLSLEQDSRLAAWMAENSAPAAYGRNVVNVILVDFRALDTFGEIAVLGVAAVGVYALLRGTTPGRAA